MVLKRCACENIDGCTSCHGNLEFLEIHRNCDDVGVDIPKKGRKEDENKREKTENIPKFVVDSQQFLHLI